MGLDQYATARKGNPTVDEDGYKQWEDSMELAYWRKHPNLQGFMEELWISKGTPGLKASEQGSVFGSDFNCVDLELTSEDLDTLEEGLDSVGLPETTGFFFGDDADEHYKEQDREFILSARNAIEDGYTVVYSSWW
jgi:hypothetical protein